MLTVSKLLGKIACMCPLPLLNGRQPTIGGQPHVVAGWLKMARGWPVMAGSGGGLKAGWRSPIRRGSFLLLSKVLGNENSMLLEELFSPNTFLQASETIF